MSQNDFARQQRAQQLPQQGQQTPLEPYPPTANVPTTQTKQHVQPSTKTDYIDLDDYVPYQGDNMDSFDWLLTQVGKLCIFI